MIIECSKMPRYKHHDKCYTKRNSKAEISINSHLGQESLVMKLSFYRQPCSETTDDNKKCHSKATINKQGSIGVSTHP